MKTMHKWMKRWMPGPILGVILFFSLVSMTSDKYLRTWFTNGVDIFLPIKEKSLLPAFNNTTYRDTAVGLLTRDTTLFGQTVRFDSFQVVSISGLPPGITYSCDDQDCSWINQGTGVYDTLYVIFSGNPVIGTAGSYAISINYRKWVTFFGSPTPIDDNCDTLTIHKFNCNAPGPLLPICSLGTDLHVNSNPTQAGYFIGNDQLSSTSTIIQPFSINFIGKNAVNLFPDFQVNNGSTFTAATCPD